MIQVKELNSFTPKVKLYLFTNLLFLVLILSGVFSVAWQADFLFTFFILLVTLGAPFYIYILLAYNSWSFLLDDNNITINSGIIVKKSRTIAFDKIENVSLKRGVMMRIFGITNFDIWTASPSQINVAAGKSLHKSDGNLILNKEEAEWLQKFITNK